MFRVLVVSIILIFPSSIYAVTDRTLDEEEELNCLSFIYIKNIFGDEKPKRLSSGGWLSPTPGEAVKPFKQGDYLPKLSRIEKAAEEGNLFAHAALMEMNLTGTCVEENWDQALYHMEKSWAYIGYSMFLMQYEAIKGNDKKYIKEAYKWLRVAILRYPYIDENRIRFSLEQRGMASTDDNIKRFIMSVQPEKDKLDEMLQQLKTTAGLTSSDIEDAEKEAKGWIENHPAI